MNLLPTLGDQYLFSELVSEGERSQEAALGCQSFEVRHLCLEAGMDVFQGTSV